MLGWQIGRADEDEDAGQEPQPIADEKILISLNAISCPASRIILA
jgi:hypothetical protein